MQTKGTVKIEIQAPRSLMHQIMTTAIEAGTTYGIGYWACYEGNAVDWDTDSDGNIYRLRFTFAEKAARDAAGGASAELTYHDIARALGLALNVSDLGEWASNGTATAAAQILAGDLDGPSADTIIQLAVFGKLIYG